MKYLGYCVLLGCSALAPKWAQAANLDCESSPTWTAQAVFTGGSQAVYNQVLYKANWWTQGANPELRSGPWQEWTKLGVCESVVVTPAPTIAPTATPTLQPTVVPTVEPSIAPSPTPAPTPEPTPANQAPEIIISMLQSSTLTVGESLNLIADATDLDGSVSSVQWFDQGELVANVTTAPFELQLTPSVGLHSYSAVAVDNEGAASVMSNVLSVNVEDVTYPAPSVALLPLNESEINLGQAITLIADATDTNDQLTEVRFFDAGVKIGSSNQAPYQFTFIPELGTHSLTAIAYNERGQSSEPSNTLNLKVTEPIAQPVTSVIWHSPAMNSSYIAGDSIILDVTGTSSDPTRNIVSVDYYANGQLLASVNQAPFTFDYILAQLGMIELTAIASDDTGISGEASVTIQVSQSSEGNDFVYFNNFEQHAVGPYSESAFIADWNMSPTTSAGVADQRLNIVIDPNPVSNQVTNQVLRVEYQAGKVGGSSASVFNYTIPASSHQHLWLQYKVRFDDNFTWVKGGKLPGLAGWDTGQKPTGCVTNSLLDGFSARFMWRENGHALSYQYSPVKTEYCGDYDSTYTFFKPGQWYTITTQVTLNQVGQADGKIDAYIDGQLVLQLQDLTLRTHEQVFINKLLFETFFGGSSSDWAPATPQYSYFDDIVISETSPLGLVNTQKSKPNYTQPLAGYQAWQADQTYPENTKVYRLDSEGYYQHYQARKYVHKNKDPLVESLPEAHLEIYNPVRLDLGQYWVLLENPEH